MSFSVRYHEDGDYVVIRLEGTIDAETAQHSATAGSDLAFRQDTNRVLVDLRRVEFGMGAEELCELPAQIADAMAQRSMPVQAFRRAILFSDQAEECRTFETAALNEGWNTRAFDSIDEAERWLDQD
jgi:hypothetical protein